MSDKPESSTARNGRLFKAAWQKSVEQAIRQELLEIAKRHTAVMYAEMNKRALEVVADLQARLILNDQFDEFNGTCTIQLLLPPELRKNPPDGGEV